VAVAQVPTPLRPTRSARLRGLQPVTECPREQSINVGVGLSRAIALLRLVQIPGFRGILQRLSFEPSPLRHTLKPRLGLIAGVQIVLEGPFGVPLFKFSAMDLILLFDALNPLIEVLAHVVEVPVGGLLVGGGLLSRLFVGGGFGWRVVCFGVSLLERFAVCLCEAVD